MKNQRWRRGYLSSFRFAFEGILFALRTQRNMKIHCMAGGCAALLAIIMSLSALQTAMLFSAIALVICLELVNTAIEQVVDMVQPEYHPLAKAAKDTAAAAVLVAAVFAVCIGGLILGPEVAAVCYHALDKEQAGRWILSGLCLVLSGLCVFAILIGTFYNPSRRVSLKEPSQDKEEVK